MIYIFPPYIFRPSLKIPIKCLLVIWRSFSPFPTNPGGNPTNPRHRANRSRGGSFMELNAEQMAADFPPKIPIKFLPSPVTVGKDRSWWWLGCQFEAGTFLFFYIRFVVEFAFAKNDCTLYLIVVSVGFLSWNISVLQITIEASIQLIPKTHHLFWRTSQSPRFQWGLFVEETPLSLGQKGVANVPQLENAMSEVFHKRNRQWHISNEHIHIYTYIAYVMFWLDMH